LICWRWSDQSELFKVKWRTRIRINPDKDGFWIGFLIFHMSEKDLRSTFRYVARYKKHNQKKKNYPPN
jgi:hypothetical protein